ncbi:hypothetical protein B9Z55_009134 [Caenorhabditis nigoni]|uniref:Tyrosine-protein phosphatase domain-containing protein n=1 Tax=Caenorhabditis nigoni TaxID=1611254 RepID=A0A2G5UQM8_9PELO|nr:hypothetical protein B9Z55_009134 [Caenorhabditis nigoni]
MNIYILFILVFVSYGFSRFSRDTSDTNLKLSVDRMEKIARITYGIYIQKGLTDGEISIDEIFKIKNLNQVFEDSGALKNELKSLVTVSKSLRKSPDIKKNQDYFLALEAIRKKVDGLGDVEKWAESGAVQKITENLKDKEIDLPKVEKFLDICQKLDEALKFLTSRKNLEYGPDKAFATTHFSVLKDEGTLLASETKILNIEHPDIKTISDIKSVQDPLSVIFQATDAAKELIHRFGAFATNDEAEKKNFENFQEIWTYSQKSSKNIQALKSVEVLMTSPGQISNQTSFEKMFRDLNDPWIKSVIKSPEFPKSLESLKVFEAPPLKKVQANLKGSGGQKIPIFYLLLTTDYKSTEAENAAKAFSICASKIPTPKISTTNMDSLKTSSQNMEKSVDGLKSILDSLMEISKDPEFQKMLSDVIGFAESSVGDLQGAFDKFKSYQDYGKFNEKVLKIKSLVEKIKNLKSDLKTHAFAVHENVGKVADFQKNYKPLSDGFGCLKGVKNSGNLIGMIDLTRSMESLNSSSLDSLEKYIEKIEKISPDLKKLQNDMNALKGKGPDGLDLLKDRKTHSEVISMATQGIGAMKTAIEKKAEIQKILPELKLVDDLKKTSKSLDQKDLNNLDSLIMMEASLDEMYQSLESWKSSLKNPESTNLIDHHEIFAKAKAVSGLSLDLLEIGTSLEKLIGETTDAQKKAKLEKVLKMVDEMAFVGMEFSRYSKSFDDSKKTLTALDVFFASYAKSPPGSSGSFASSTTQNPAESPDHTTLLICVIASILVLIMIVGCVLVFRRYKKKQRRKNALAPLTLDGVITVPKKPPTKSSTKTSTKSEKKPLLQPELPLDKTQSDHNSSKSKKSEKKVEHKEELSENRTQNDDDWCDIQISEKKKDKFCDGIFGWMRKTKELIGNKDDGNVYTFFWQFVTRCLENVYLKNASETEYCAKTEGKVDYSIEENTRVFVTRNYPMDANYVRFPNSLEFILGKNPTDKEEARVFWHMIKETQTEQMFMMGGFEEGKKTICYKYIPLKEGEIVTVKSKSEKCQFQIKCTECKKFANGQVVRRKLEVKYKDIFGKKASFTLEHVQYGNSEEADLSECPMNPKIFSNLVRIARKNKKPVIIHCRDGVNRSGAFAYVEWLIQKFGKKPEEGKKMEDIDFVDELQALRKMKKHAVSNEILFGFSILSVLTFLYGNATCELIEKLKIEYNLRFNWKKNTTLKEDTETVDDIREMDAQWKKDKDAIDAIRAKEQTLLEKLLAERRKEKEKEGWIYSEKGYTRHRNTGKDGEWYQEDDDWDIRDFYDLKGYEGAKYYK